MRTRTVGLSALTHLAVGDGSSANRWIFYDSVPSVTATNDPDGDGSCTYVGRITSTSNLPPTGTNTWRVSCDGSWTNVSVTITENECITTTSTSDDGSDGNFYCANGGTAVGTVGSCACVSCNAGFSGPNCATADIFELSGSNIGNCAVNGACFSSLNYGNDERCTFTTSESGALNFISFNTETAFDKLTVGEVQYDGSNGPRGMIVSAGEEITWYSDVYGSGAAGFAICLVDPCVATTSASDDGSDGTC